MICVANGILRCVDQKADLVVLHDLSAAFGVRDSPVSWVRLYFRRFRLMVTLRCSIGVNIGSTLTSYSFEKITAYTRDMLQERANIRMLRSTAS